MPLIASNGKLLRTSSGLASSLDCCCGDIPCECIDGYDGCVPAGQTGHRDPVLVISNVPDEAYSITTITRFPCTIRTCSPGDTITSVTTHKISGLSQINGSYPTLYVDYDPVEGWVEADYGTGCKWWASPIITFEFEWETTVVSDHNPFSDTASPCNPTSTSTGGTFEATFSAWDGTFDIPAEMHAYIPPMASASGFGVVPYHLDHEWMGCVGRSAELSSTTAYSNNPFDGRSPFDSSPRSGPLTALLGTPHYWGPQGRVFSPAPMPGYRLGFADYCRLGGKRSDRRMEEVEVFVSGVGGTGNCANRTDRYYSPFRVTRELFINE